ncbi:MAG TPA: DUF1016 domain-containing protein [Prolixibacteraceae bacterium]|nr:DUF1016 domain-containing protein [Prolixibacteraceae bacterium]
MQSQFSDIVAFINLSRNNAIKSVNAELINLYWNVGAHISKKIATANWGEKTVDELAAFIQRNHPEFKGFNKRGLYRMRQFYETYIEMAIVSPLGTQIQSTENEKDKIVSSLGTQLELSDIRKTILAKLTWTHHRTIFSRCKTNEEREFYLRLSIKENYSVRELDRQISSSLFERAMLSNTKQIPVLNNLAPNINQHFRDSYVFEFLNLPEPFSENDLQKGLIRQMKMFILELGKDFLFVDEEYRLQVGNKDYRCDLLFYHRELQCLVAFELKTESFEPEHLGKINFYLEALDRDVKKPHENPSIGILLCKDKNTEVVEYAMSRQMSPTLISQYTLALPDKKLLQAKLHELFEMWNDKLGEE